MRGSLASSISSRRLQRMHNRRAEDVVATRTDAVSSGTEKERNEAEKKVATAAAEAATVKPEAVKAAAEAAAMEAAAVEEEQGREDEQARVQATESRANTVAVKGTEVAEAVDEGVEEAVAGTEKANDDSAGHDLILRSIAHLTSRALEDEDASVRRAAVSALGPAEIALHAADLVARLEDGDEAVRRAAVETLGSHSGRTSNALCTLRSLTAVRCLCCRWRRSSILSPQRSRYTGPPSPLSSTTRSGAQG